MISILVFIFYLLLTPGNVQAQNNYTIDHYTGDNGLPQNSIKSITADTEGFIWLATEDGLTRFDGRSFKVYNNSNLKIKENRVYYIKYAIRDTIYVRSHKGNGRNKRLYAYFAGGELARIENGAAIIDTLYINKIKKYQSNYIDHLNVFESIGYPNNIISTTHIYEYKITVDNEYNHFYLCKDNRIIYYENRIRKYEVKISIPTNSIKSYFSLAKKLYFLNDNASITRIWNNKVEEIPLSGEILMHPGYGAKKDKIRLFWNHTSDQAFLYLDHNLYELDAQENGKLDTKLLVENFDLDLHGVNQVHYDGIGKKIYLGSDTQGLFVIAKQQFQAITIKGSSAENVFYAQLSYGKDEILTPNGYVIQKPLQPKQINFRRIAAIGNINGADLGAIIRDKDGTIWTKNGPTLIHLGKTGENILHNLRFKNYVKAMHQDKTGRLWLGILNQGLYSIDPQNLTIEPQHFAPDTLLDITYLESQTPDKLLVGTKTGLYIVDLNTKHFNRVKGTENVFIKSIHVGNRNQVWVTALGKGLMLLNEKGELINFPLDKNKFLTSPHCIVNDARGFFWIPTNNGLFQMAIKDLLLYAKLKSTENKNHVINSALPSELYYVYHTKEEGFNINEFNGNCRPCAVKLANGYISLPSLNGLMWFKPEEITNYIPDGHIIMDQAEVNQTVMAILGDSLRFPINPENIKLSFSTAYFRNGYNLNLSYTLIRQNDSANSERWIPIDNKDFTIRYSSLSSGNYTLMIRKLNGFGINNYSIKKVYLIILPFWYETLWAKALFIVGFVFLFLFTTYFYNIYRLNVIKKENELLQREILKHTLSLNHTLQKLKVSKNQMSIQIHVMSRLLASITHDIQSPLHYIANTSGDIPEMIQAGKFDKVSQLGSIISNVSNQTNNMLKDLLDYIKIQVYGNRMQFEDINLKKLIDFKLESFKDVIEINGSGLIYELSSATKVSSDYQLLSIIIHNLIDNAVKYTGKGKINIYARIDEKRKVELIISNTSNRIPTEMIELMNSSSENSSIDHPIKNDRSTRLGLLIVKEIAELVGITIKVTQTDMTNFHLYFK